MSLPVRVDGRFDIDGRPVSFSISGTGEEDYTVTSVSTVFDRACAAVEKMIEAIKVAQDG